MRRILLALAFAATLGAQTFIQMSDPQFGMYAENKGFEHETANFEFAVATANRLKPAFVVLTGATWSTPRATPRKIAEFKRVAGKLDPNIRLFLMPGNHDAGNEPTKESLRNTASNSGRTTTRSAWATLPESRSIRTWRRARRVFPRKPPKMEVWFRAELAKAQRDGAKHLIVFQHIPFFLKDANEEDRYENIPRETRQRYLKLLHEFGVKQVFAGHYHSTSEARDGDLEMITTGPVGSPCPRRDRACE